MTGTHASARVAIADPAAFGRVAVLMGGFSAERDISLLTGNAVLQALLEREVDAHRVDWRGDLPVEFGAGSFDRVWIALHGRGGEDGAMQGYLQTVGVPYTGSGVAASALAMDKLRTKQVLAAEGLPTPAWRRVDRPEDCAAAAEALGLPVIVKPVLEGSSIGMTKVTELDQLSAAWQCAADCASGVMLEACVTGPEYSAAILQGHVLPLVGVEPEDGFYDFAAKYQSSGTRYRCPAGLDADVERMLGAMSLAAFDAVGASGWGRVDFMLDAADARASILEVNTVPGMTSHSLVPMAAAQAGIDFAELCWRILETSCEQPARAAAAGTPQC